MNTLVTGWVIAQLATGSGLTDLNPIRWLSGCWQTRDGVVTEVWSPPVSGVMVGVGVTSIDDRAPSFEHLRIETEPDGGIVYVALPSGQSETRFHSTHVDDSGFLVENLAHDFPTRIRYAAHDRDAFTARVEGPPDEGGTRGFELVFERVECEDRR